MCEAIPGKEGGCGGKEWGQTESPGARVLLSLLSDRQLRNLKILNSNGAWWVVMTAYFECRRVENISLTTWASNL